MTLRVPVNKADSVGMRKLSSDKAMKDALETLKGKPKVGKTIRIVGLPSQLRTAVTYKFQWYAGKKAIKKARKSSLKVTKAMRGKAISVKVTITAGVWGTVSQMSGNCMPIVGPGSSCRNCAVQRTVRF